MLLELPELSEKHQLHKSENPLNIQGRPDTEPCSVREADEVRGNTISSGRFFPVVKKKSFTREKQAHPIPKERAVSRRNTFGRCLPEEKGYKLQLSQSCWGHNLVTTTLSLSCLFPQTASEELKGRAPNQGIKGAVLKNLHSSLATQKLRPVSTQDWRAGSDK